MFLNSLLLINRSSVKFYCWVKWLFLLFNSVSYKLIIQWLDGESEYLNSCLLVNHFKNKSCSLEVDQWLNNWSVVRHQFYPHIYIKTCTAKGVKLSVEKTRFMQNKYQNNLFFSLKSRVVNCQSPSVFLRLLSLPNLGVNWQQKSRLNLLHISSLTDRTENVNNQLAYSEATGIICDFWFLNIWRIFS